jgi:hypothetical protein
MEESAPLWRLRSASTSKFVECRISAARPSRFSLVVVWGLETLFQETYPDSSTAQSRASELRDRLLKHGEWQLDRGVATAG